MYGQLVKNQVGDMTYMTCVSEVAAGIGIPEHNFYFVFHFWYHGTTTGTPTTPTTTTATSTTTGTTAAATAVGCLQLTGHMP